MAKELFISTTPHETKVAVVEDEQLAEIYFERENEYTLAGSIYKGRVTRVLPGMQSAFVDIGLERDAFLYVTDFLEEQEDQEEFEHAVNRAHSDAQQPPRPQHQYSPAAVEGETEQLQAQEAQATTGDQESQAGAAPLDRAPRRWRGRRGRRRRGGFQDQAAPQSSTQSSPQVTVGGETLGSAAPEPIVLPGESLSKYRRAQPAGEEHGQQSPSAASEVQPERQTDTHATSEPERHVTQDAPASTGPVSVLPGESISKYRNRGETPSEPVAQQPVSNQERSYGRSESRWQRPNRRPERESAVGQGSPSGSAVFAL